MNALAQARAAHFRALTQQRSDFVRAGIRRAIPAEVKYHGLWCHGLATRVRERIERLGPQLFGLESVPDVETISSVIKQLREEQMVSTTPETVAMASVRTRYVLQHSLSASTT